MQSISAKDGHATPSYMVDGAQGPVRLQYFAPPERLRAYFGPLYVFTQTADRYSDVTRADVPQLRFMLKGQGQYHFHDGTTAATPDICLVGPTFGATRFELDSPAHVVGISLLPAGWVSMGGGDASLVADRLLDLGEARSGALLDLLGRLRSLNDAEAMAQCCWLHLARWLEPLPESTWRLLEAVDAWLMAEGSPRIETLAERTGLSPRQLARLTNRYYGCPPKLLARKYRALRCSARIALDHHSWQELCEDGRFYDQSHFIREIK
ncbi:MAG TPA: AraC family transcriptional regulator, partial [Sphingobium sp.]|nr:AraC family transcriptional regulator [Sphingobium sp.]